jgi:hypothetical protein
MNLDWGWMFDVCILKFLLYEWVCLLYVFEFTCILSYDRAGLFGEREEQMTYDLLNRYQRDVYSAYTALSWLVRFGRRAKAGKEAQKGVLERNEGSTGTSSPIRPENFIVTQTRVLNDRMDD